MLVGNHRRHVLHEPAKAGAKSETFLGLFPAGREVWPQW
jgi:hypothetical protein